MTGLRTTLADGAAADPVLGIEDDHALIAVIFAVQSEEGDLVCRHFREGEELLRRNEQVKVAGGDGRRRIGVRSIELKSEIVLLIASLDCELAALVIPQKLHVFRTSENFGHTLGKKNGYKHDRHGQLATSSFANFFETIKNGHVNPSFIVNNYVKYCTSLLRIKRIEFRGIYSYFQEHNVIRKNIPQTMLVSMRNSIRFSQRAS